MTADTKKAQTFINVIAQQLRAIRAARDTIEQTRLQGNVTAVGNAWTLLKAEIDKTIWTNFIAAEVPTHRNEALEE